MFMTRTIAGNLLHKYSTRLHPFVKRDPLPNSRSKLVFDADTCILCQLCSRKCPSQVISMEPETGLWELNVMGCVNCGVCADVCPTNSIHMVQEYRAPLTERTMEKYYCKPKPKKAKGEAAGASAKASAAPAKTADAPEPVQEENAAAAPQQSDARPAPPSVRATATISVKQNGPKGKGRK